LCFVNIIYNYNMDEEKKTNESNEQKKDIAPKGTEQTIKADIKPDTNKEAAVVVAKSVYGARRKTFKTGRKRAMSGRDDRKDEFEQRILDIARVTRVMAGGKRMRFRACVAIGDRKGKVAVALGKGADVTLAVTKAVNKAKKHLIDVSIVNDTIPHEIYLKYGAAKLLFKPARKGRGVVAGGVVRVILELAGVQNITCKIMGTNNKVSNANCTIEALRSLKKIETKKEGEEKNQIKK